MAHRKLRRLKIAEISAVDRPAQEGARMVLMKRADDAGTTSFATAKNHEGDDMTTEIEALKKQLDEQTALVKAFRAVVALTPSQRAYYDALPEVEQTAFVAKSSVERDTEVAKALESDPVVATVDGRAIRKSQDPTGVLAALAKRDEENRSRLAASEASAAQLVLEKRADAEIGKLPGDVRVRGAIVKAIDGIADEATRKAAHAAVQAGSAAIAAGMNELGHNGGDAPAPLAKLDTLAKERAKTQGISYAKAYDLNLEDNPEARSLMAEINRSRMTSVPR